MTFQEKLTACDKNTNAERTGILKYGPQEKMGRAHRTYPLIIVSDHTKSIYQNHWTSVDGNHYSGRGLTGNQTLDDMQSDTP